MKEKLEELIRISELDNDSYYIIDLENLANDLQLFKKAFHNLDYIISYSYKTNYLKSIIKYLDSNEIKSELVSPFEIEISKNYSVNPASIIYNGPLKDKQSISYVLEGKGIVHADSLDDLILISDVVKNSKKPIYDSKIGVRLSIKDDKLISRFGIEYDKNNFKYILNKFREINYDFPYSLHFHYPSRDFNSFKYRINKIIQILEEIFNDYGEIPKYIDIGGGFPSKMPDSVLKTLNNNVYLPINKYGEYIFNAIENSNLPKFTLILEPGTAIVANSMLLVANIKSIINKSNKSYLNTDISRNLIGGLSNAICYPVNHISRLKRKNNEKKGIKKYLLAGYTCVEGDLMGYLELDSKPEINDKIVISNIGSYSNVFKSPFIRPDIATYSWNGENLICVRRSQLANDITSLDLI